MPISYRPIKWRALSFWKAYLLNKWRGKLSYLAAKKMKNPTFQKGEFIII